MLRTLVRSLSLVAFLAGSAAAAGGSAPVAKTHTASAKVAKHSAARKAKQSARKNQKHTKRKAVKSGKKSSGKTAARPAH